MTAPSQTSTDKPDSSQPGSGAGMPEDNSNMEPAITSAAEAGGAKTEKPEEVSPRETKLGPDDPGEETSGENTAGPNTAEGSGESTPEAVQPRDLWVDELHSLTVLELHERFAQIRMR